jgi:hypothetical protein
VLVTRRQLLVSAAAISMPVAAAIPWPDEPRGRLRLGLLQSRQPFMDPHDIAGSRERAFSAYRVLIRRSLEQQRPLHWLAGGAFPLSGPGPFPGRVLEQLALTERSAEVTWLKSFTRRHRLRLTLGGWWQEPGANAAHRLLTFDGRGQCQVSPPSEHWVGESIQLHVSTPRGVSSLPRFARQCGRLHHHGAWIETLQGPVLPPGVRPPMPYGSALVGPDGRLIAHAGAQTECCLVAEVG